MSGPEMVVALSIIGTIGWVLHSVITLFGRRVDGKSRPAFNPETDARIARIEQAVDAIALEIERVSEGQRFTTRLLSERAAQPLAAPKPPVQS